MQHIVSGKLALKYQGTEIEAMKEVASASKNRSLAEFQNVRNLFSRKLYNGATFTLPVLHSPLLIFFIIFLLFQTVGGEEIFKAARTRQDCGKAFGHIISNNAGAKSMSNY